MRVLFIYPAVGRRIVDVLRLSWGRVCGHRYDESFCEPESDTGSNDGDDGDDGDGVDDGEEGDDTNDDDDDNGAAEEHELDDGDDDGNDGDLGRSNGSSDRSRDLF